MRKEKGLLLFPKNRYEQVACDFIDSVFRQGGKIGVACSGGADSVCLLLGVMELFGGARENIKVLHFNHCVRGETADADAEFVRKLALKLGVEFICGSPQELPKKASEDSLRQMRLSFFVEQSARLGLACIAQGHHANDIVETLVMRLIRGVGTDGFSAPRAISHYKGAIFVRPLLTLKKSEIVAALSQNKITWCEDETNVDCDFLRNKIRKDIFPRLEDVSSGDICMSARRTKMLMQEDADFIAEFFNREINRANPQLEILPLGKNLTRLDLSDVLKNNAAMFRRAVRLLISKNTNLSLSRAKGLDDFVFKAMTTGKARLSAGDSWEIFFSGNALEAVEKIDVDEFSITLQNGKNVLPNGASISVKKATLTQVQFDAIKGGNNDDSKRAYIDLSASGGLVDGVLIARSRKAGDKYRPLGSASKKRLKDIMSSKKVPIWKRKSAIVVCNKKGDILWVAGLPPSEDYKVDKSHSVIELTFKDI